MPGHPARPVQVTARQEDLLRKLVRGTKTPQRLAQRAQIVLLGADGRSSEDIVEQMAVTRPMVRKWRRRWSEAEDQLRAVEDEESDSAVHSRICEILADAPRSGRPPDILPEQILEIVAIACEDPDTAQRPISHWTPGEVAREAVRRGIYQALQTPRQMDEGLLLRMLKGIATRNYEACAETVPEAFGLSRSSVSRRYVKGTARKLAEFQERSLEGYDLVALFLDGKSFADEEIIIALGVTLDGQKIPLGFVQAATENERVCRRFLSDLVERGLQYEAGLLVVIDGGKGLYKSVMSVLRGHACVQRCQYHKRQNVVSYLPKSEHSGIRRKMEAAYGKPTYAEAKAALDALKPGLKLINQSALRSLEEGLEETLTLHRLGLMPMLKNSFRTTNCIENVNSLLEQLTHNVRRWTNSSQRHRWVATALLDIEPRLRRVKGYNHLPMLRQAIQAELGITQLAMTG